MGFFAERRFAVTGGAGFLGRHVARRLTELGAREVFVPRSARYDLVEREAIRRFYDDARPDIVIHLAAKVGGIGANRARPATFFYDNLMMGVQLLDEGWRRGIEKFVAVGTVCGYPKFTPVPFREEALWDGYPEETNAPYGLAKKMLAVQSLAYRQQHGFRSVTLLPANLYGPGDHDDLADSHVIPALIRKFLEAKARGESEVVLWGDGTPTREFLHVADAAEGILLATERYDDSEPMNLGSACEIAIADLARLIAELCGWNGKVRWDAAMPNGQPRRRLDTSRAERLIGFKARVGLREGLEEAVRRFSETRKTRGS